MPWFSRIYPLRHKLRRPFVLRASTAQPSGNCHAARTVVGLLALGLGGCAAPLINPNQPASESVVLADVRQLTHGFGRAGEGAFSPDMRWIVFHAGVPGEAYDQVFVAPLQRDGDAIVGMGRPIRISPRGSANAGAAISPNGRSIILSSTGPRQGTDGQAPRFLTDTVAPTTSPALVPDGMPSTPAPSTSTPTAIPATRLFRADNWESAVNSAAGSGAVVDLTRYPIPGDLARAVHPAWSPDGNSIAFAGQETPDGDVDLYVARPDGSARIRVTSEPGFEAYPSFSPGGRKLLFTRPLGPDLLTIELKAQQTDGQPLLPGQQQVLVPGATDARRATWVPPDGQRVVYASTLVGQAVPRLRVIRSDGRMRTDLTLSGGGGDMSPVVSPDGRYLLWTSRRSADGSPQLFLARFTLPPGV
jgi:TolB protein